MTQVTSQWRRMSTAPRDGSLIRLLVHFEDMSIDDGDGPFATIGQNNRDNDGEDCWQFVGWCWEHDHFTDGKGAVVGWLPLEPEDTHPERATIQALVDIIDRELMPHIARLPVQRLDQLNETLIAARKLLNLLEGGK